MMHKPTFIIITSTDLKDSISEYVNIKRHKYRIIIVLTEDIYKRYPSLTKVDAIKTYLISKYEKEHIRYALIIGNSSKVPTPTFYDDDIEENVAYENYYCCYKDSVVPLFSLSRIPASDKEDALRQLNFVLNYGGAGKNICFITDACTAGKNEYRQNTEFIAQMITEKFNVIKHYDKESSKNELIETINNGVDFLNYRGHGYCFSWRSSIGPRRKDVQNLKNGTRIVFSIACNTAAIHIDECFAETWMKNLKSIAFLGASSPTYRVINSEFNKYIWEAICYHGMTTVGDIFKWAVLALYRSGLDPERVKHNIKCYVQLGDPTADYKEKVQKGGFHEQDRNFIRTRTSYPRRKGHNRRGRRVSQGNGQGCRNFTQCGRRCNCFPRRHNKATSAHRYHNKYVSQLANTGLRRFRTL